MFRFISIFLVSILFLTQPSTPLLAQAEFVVNEGQWETTYRYHAKLRHGDLWIKNGKAFFVLSDFGRDDHDSATHPHGNPARAKFHGYEMEFSGSSQQASLEGTGKFDRYHNYYVKGRRNWRSGVGIFSGTMEKNLYPGIDLYWKESRGNLKYEFYLKPGSDPGQIRITYRGLDSIRLEGDELLLTTRIGVIREQKPIAWQTDPSGNRKMIPCRFLLSESGITSFAFPEGYDPSKPLVIDPILVFSTFSGSRSDNWGFTSTYGEESSPYAAGISLGPHFPVTPGAFGPGFSGDSIGTNIYSTYDIGILKFNPSGTNLLYATYLGGSEAEAPASIVVDQDSCLVVLGTSSSSDFPVSESAFDQSFNGGVPVSPYGPGEGIVRFRTGSDLVISRFSKDGQSLLGSTFLGGSANDGLLSLIAEGNSPLVKNYGDSFRGEVIVDSAGRICIASHTSSLDFPLANPVQSQLGGGSDAVLAILSRGLDSLLFSTYHGGSNDDAAFSLQVGINQNLYISGGTASPDFPASPGTVKPNFGGAVDGFISLFKPGSPTQVRTTFLGTNRFDQSYFVQTDQEGNVYSYGQTIGNYPVTPGVFSNPGSSQFIHCLSGNLDSTRFSTVFGSGTQLPNISPTAFLVDACGRIYCSGWGGGINNLSGYLNGNTLNLPTTPASGSQTTDGSDFYILVLEKNATEIVFGTYFGDSQNSGEHVDGGTSRFDKRGVIYQAVCAGCGGTSTFPTTPGVVSNVNGSSNCNNALFVYDFSKLQARYASTSTGGCVPLSLKFKSISVYDQQIKWDFDDGTVVSGNSQDSILHTFQDSGIFKVKLVAYNPEGCPAKDSTIQFITVQRPVLFPGDTIDFCSPDETVSFPALPGGNLTYNWSPSDFLSSTDQRLVQAISPDTSIWYTATVTTSEGCQSSSRFLLRNRNLQVKASADTVKGCVPLSVNFSSLGRYSQRERWYFTASDSSAVLSPNSNITKVFSSPGIYRVVLKVENDTSCALSITDTIQIVALGSPVVPDTLFRYCENGFLQLAVPADSASFYNWTPGTLLNDSLVSNPIMPIAAPAIFNLQVKDTNGCRASARIEVRDGRLRAAFAIDSSSVCAPVQISLSGQSQNPVISRYYLGNDSVTVTGNNPAVFQVAEKGYYLVRLRVFSDTACLAFSDTSLPLRLGAPLELDTLFRFCNSGTLSLQLPGSDAIKSIRWSPGNLLNDSLTANPILLNAAPAVFSLLAEDSAGCKSVSNAEVRDGRLRAAFGINSGSVCAPVQVSLSGQSLNPVISRYYLGNDSVTVLGNLPASFSIPASGRFIFRLRVFSDTACVAFSDTSITRDFGGPGNGTPVSLSYCRGDSVRIQAPEIPGYRYFWPAGAILSGDSSKAVFLPQDSLRVKVRLVDSLFCAGERNFNLRRIQPDTALQVLSEFEPCSDRLQYRFSASGNSENSYSWKLNGKAFSGNQITDIFPARGNYLLQLYARKAACLDSVRKTISVQDPPLLLKADFQAELQWKDCNSPPAVEVKNTSEGNDQSIWQWNGQSSFSEVPQIFPNGEDTIRLTLLAYKGLCLRELAKKIPVFPLRPNNLITLREDGMNDFLSIENLPSGTFLEVHDRWGIKVHQEENYQGTWRPEHEGIYFYRIQLPNGPTCKSWVEAIRDR